MSTTPFEFGDIVLIRFPFTDQVNFKQRPAVIVSNRTYNATRPDLVIMAITSQVKQNSVSGDVNITEWQAAGLLKPSAVKPVFATVEHGLVLKVLGKLQPVDASALKSGIMAILG